MWTKHDIKKAQYKSVSMQSFRNSVESMSAHEQGLEENCGKSKSWFIVDGSLVGDFFLSLRLPLMLL